MLNCDCDDGWKREQLYVQSQSGQSLKILVHLSTKRRGTPASMWCHSQHVYTYGRILISKFLAYAPRVLDWYYANAVKNEIVESRHIDTSLSHTCFTIICKNKTTLLSCGRLFPFDFLEKWEKEYVLKRGKVATQVCPIKDCAQRIKTRPLTRT